MSTRHVILGLIRERPSHSYDVVLRFGKRLEPWRVNRGQVYRTITALANEGLLEEHEAEGPSERSGPSWRITDTGKRELEHWFAVRSEDVEPLRSELLAKLAVAEPCDAPNLLAAVDWYERELAHQIQADVTARRAAPAESSWAGDVERCIADAALLHHDAELAWTRRVREVVESWAHRAAGDGELRPLDRLAI